MKKLKNNIITFLIVALSFLSQNASSADDDYALRQPSEEAINYSTIWGLSVKHESTQYNYQITSTTTNKSDYISISSSDYFSILSSNYFSISSDDVKDHQLFYTSGTFEDESVYLEYLAKLIHNILSGPQNILAFELNYSSGLTTNAWKVIFNEVSIHPEKTLIILSSSYISEFSTFNDSLLKILDEIREEIPKNIIFIPKKNAESLNKADRAILDNWAHLLSESNRAYFNAYQVYKEERKRLQEQQWEQEREQESKILEERPSKFKSLYDKSLEKLEEKSKEEKQISESDSRLLQYLLPHEGIQLSPQAQRVNWEKIAPLKVLSLPPIPDKYKTYYTLDPEKLASALANISKNLDARDTLSKETINSFIKIIQSPYNLSKSLQKQSEILEYLALTINWLEEHIDDKDRVISLLSELIEQFSRCEDAKLEVLSNFVRGLYYGTNTKEYFTEQLNELIAQAKIDFSKQIFTTLQKPSKQLVLYLHKKAKEDISNLKKHEDYLYGLYFGLKIEKKYKTNNTFSKSPIKSDAYNLCPSFIRNVMSSRFESPAVIQALNNTIADRIGLPKISETAFLTGTAPDMWKIDYEINPEITEIVFKNNFDANFLINLVNNHLRTISREQLINLTTDNAQKLSLTRQYPLSFNILMNDPILQHHVNEFYEEVPYHLVTSNITLTYEGQTVELMAGDFIHADFVTEEMKINAEISQHTEEFYDFNPTAAEKILITLGYISASKDTEPLDNSSKTPFLKNQSRLLENTPLVHAFDDDGKILQTLTSTGILQYSNVSESSSSVDFPERNTIHFSWWNLVGAHNKGSWENKRFALIDLSQAFKGELFGTKKEDTMVIGKHVCSADTILLVPNGTVIDKQAFPGKIMSYHDNLREAVNTVTSNFLKLQKLPNTYNLEQLKESGKIVADLPVDHDGSLFDEIEKVYAFKSALLSPEYTLEESSNLIHPKVIELRWISSRLEDLKIKAPEVSDYVNALINQLKNFELIIEYKRVKPDQKLLPSIVESIIKQSQQIDIVTGKGKMSLFNAIDYLADQMSIANSFRNQLFKLETLNE